MFMLTGGMLTRSFRGETDASIERRLFGSHQAAAEAWHAHRAALLAEFPTAGRRCHGYWVYERHRAVPPALEQADILARLGELTRIEIAQLDAWAALTPEPPAGLALDAVGIDPIHLEVITEDPPDAQADPVSQVEVEADLARTPEAPELATQAREVVEPEPPTKENPVKPRIIASPWYSQNGQPESVSGWETHEP